MYRLRQGATTLDILLFTSNRRRAEYFSRKLKISGHSFFTVQTLASLHHALRFSDPDFVIIDSETFPDPANDYRTIISGCRRKFLLFYDNELLDNRGNSQGNKQKRAGIHKSLHPLPETVISRQKISDRQQACTSVITDVLRDILLHRTLTDNHFNITSPEARSFLKQNRLRPPLACILRCLLQNMDTDITVETLINQLWTDNGKNHLQTLYAYMNQLRNLLKTRNIPLVIDKKLKGTYRIHHIQNVPCESEISIPSC